VEVLFAPQAVSDLSTISKDHWILAQTAVVEQGVKEIKFAFSVPFAAHNLMIRSVLFFDCYRLGFRYANFHQIHDVLEVVTCPRCRFPVTNKHGNCPKCRENAYQCRSCRNINFENLDGFLCNECGFSRFATFHYSAVVRACFVPVPITNEATRQQTIDLISSLSDSLHQRYSQVASYKKEIQKLLSKPESEKDSQGVACIANDNHLIRLANCCRSCFVIT